MAVKEAVLGLVVERRGYGYELINRFNERFGDAWRLNQGSIYDALNRLEDEELIRGYEREMHTELRQRTRRQRIIVYEALPAARERFLTWLTAPAPEVEPVRGEIVLKIGMTTSQEHALPLLRVIDAQIDVCADALALHLSRYHLDPGLARSVSWTDAVPWLLAEAAISRLQADLTWLRRVRSATEAFREHGSIPVTLLAARPGPARGWS